MIRKELRPYQVEARDRALALPGFALYLEPRTGKTLISYAVADARKPDRLLIVAPKNAIGEWKAGLKDWTGHNCDIIITTYGLAVTRRDFLQKWLESAKRPMMVVDEMHRIKQRGSRQSRAVRVLGRRAQYRLGLTGTPIAQGLEDAWSQFAYLMPEVFGNWTAFKREYLRMGGHRGLNPYTNKYEFKQIVGYRNKKKFSRILHKYSYRVKLGEVTPTKIRLHRALVWGELSEREATAYRELDKNLVTYVRGEAVTAALVITQAMKLHQVTGGFVLGDRKRRKDGRKTGSGKVLRLGRSKLDLLLSIVREDLTQKTVVIARFRHEIRAIRRALEAEGLSVHVLSKETPWERSFKTDVVVLQIAMAASIDLSDSRRTIFYSLDYSYINFEQARFRTLSYTRTRATYYFLLMRGTVDFDIYTAITKKRKLATLICDRYRKKGEDDDRRS